MSDKILNSTELAHRIAQKLDLPQTRVEAVLKEFQGAIVSQLDEGGEVRLPGFGTFKSVERGARTARNPRTGELIDVAERHVVRFVPGKNLKMLGEAKR